MNLELELESNRNKKSLNKDFYQTLNINRSSMVIPISNIDSVVNTYKVFEDERNKTTKYRLNISITPIISNVLINKLTEVRNVSDNSILIGDERINAIQTINDDIYNYRLGYDIFDNHFNRVNTFKTGNTLNDFTGTTTLRDLVSIETSMSNNLIEDNGWVGLANKSKINENRMFSNRQPCEKIDLFPTREYLLFKPIIITGESKDNWDYILTYPYENYIDNKLITNENGINGIPIKSSEIVSYNGGNYLNINTIYKHGINPGDVIKIKRIDEINTNNTYLVYDIGDINKSNKTHSFILDANAYEDLINITGMTDNRIVKVVNKVDSEYYIRKFRKLPNFTNDPDKITVDNINDKILTGNTTFQNEAYQPGFSRSIFNDSTYQIQYIDDVDINLIKDNLGRPLTEIYFTIIKKNKFSGDEEPNNIFSEVISGIDELTGTTGYYNVRLMNGITNLETPLERTITTSGSTINNSGQTNSFLGDIIEYNSTTVIETKLDDIYHRFNTIQREVTGETFTYHNLNSDGVFIPTGITLNPSKEGYFYKPHYKIQLKNYSEILTQGEIPELLNCENFISGVTETGDLITLSGETNIKYLALKIQDDSGFANFDYVRITKKDGKYLNLQIILYNIDNVILIPYISSFMGSLSDLTISDFIIRKYSNSQIPLYSQDNNNGICSWREILKEGVFDSKSTMVKDLTFTNSRLYVSEGFNFYLKRQDPFGSFGLNSNIFPADLYGEINAQTINNKIEGVNTIC